MPKGKMAGKVFWRKILNRKLRMNRKIFGAVVLLLLAMGWASFDSAAAPAVTEGKGIPAIV
jgi:hypothetical protein